MFKTVSSYIILMLVAMSLAGCSNRVTVRFETYGGEHISSMRLSPGDSLPLKVPTKEGHTFLGWYTDPSYFYEFESNDTVSSDLTLYAKWQINSYHIRYPGKYGTTSKNMTYGEDLTTIGQPEKEGFTFDGFYMDESLEEPFTLTEMPAYDLRIYAKWLRNTYTISFESHGGSSVGDMRIEFDDPIVLPSNLTKYQHEFHGWYWDADYQFPFEENKMPAQDLSLHAKWVIEQHTIFYRTEGGEELENDIYDYGETISALPVPERTGYTFQGWYLDPYDQNPYHPSTMPAHDLALYAKWRINTYRLTYHDLFKEEVDTIFLGERHTLARTKTDRLFSWGYNTHGQLADGSRTTRDTPMDITHQFNLYADEHIIEISQADSHALALTSDGRVFSWGSNLYGQLGEDRNQLTATTPVDITDYFRLYGGETIEKVYAVYMQSYAVTSTGHVFSWGNNDYNQLGNGTKERSGLPVDITSHFGLNMDERIVDLIVGKTYVLALSDRNRLFSWGLNTKGQLGNGTTDNQSVPLDITNFLSLEEDETILDVQTNRSYVFVTTNGNRLLSWGINDSGQLGDGSTDDCFLPKDITANFNLREGEHIEDLQLGKEHVIALTNHARIFTWGNNQAGQLGDGTTVTRSVPTDITDRFEFEDGETVEQLHVTDFSTVLLTSEKRVLAFGGNGRGSLGLGSVDVMLEPTDLTPNLGLAADEHITGIHLGYFRTFILTSSGKMIVFGHNAYGALGNGSDDDIRTPIEVGLFAWHDIHHVDLDYNTSIPSFVPEKEGHTFMGWFTDQTYRTPLVLARMPDEDIDLYAKYSE